MNPHVPTIEAHALRLNVARPLTFHSALEIARREIERLGLNDLYRVKAIYAGGDRHAAGATFAVILNLISAIKPASRRQSGLVRLKLLIQDDGVTSLEPFHAARACRAS